MLRRCGDQSDIDAISFHCRWSCTHSFDFRITVLPCENLKPLQQIVDKFEFESNINSYLERIQLSFCFFLIQLTLPNSMWAEFGYPRRRERERKSIKRNLLRLISIIFVFLYTNLFQFHFKIRCPLQWNGVVTSTNHHQYKANNTRIYLCAIVCWWFELRLSFYFWFSRTFSNPLALLPLLALWTEHRGRTYCIHTYSSESPYCLTIPFGKLPNRIEIKHEHNIKSEKGERASVLYLNRKQMGEQKRERKTGSRPNVFILKKSLVLVLVNPKLEWNKLQVIPYYDQRTEELLQPEAFILIWKLRVWSFRLHLPLR